MNPNFLIAGIIFVENVITEKQSNYSLSTGNLGPPPHANAAIINKLNRLRRDVDNPPRFLWYSTVFRYLRSLTSFGIRPTAKMTIILTVSLIARLRASPTLFEQLRNRAKGKNVR